MSSRAPPADVVSRGLLNEASILMSCMRLSVQGSGRKMRRIRSARQTARTDRSYSLRELRKRLPTRNMFHAAAPPMHAPGCAYVASPDPIVGGSHDRADSSSHFCWRPLLAQPSIPCSVGQAGCHTVHLLAKLDTCR